MRQFIADFSRLRIRLASATLVIATFAVAHASADESMLSVLAPAETETIAGELLQQPAADAALMNASPAPVAAPFGSVVPAMEDYEPAIPTVQPINWVSGPYLRSGVNFVFGGDLFDVSRDVGWGISGGVRQPLGPEIGGDRCFLDVGGSYQNSYGRASFRPFDGTVTTTLTSNGQVIDTDTIEDAYAASLEEIRRASAHVALGWFWGPGLDNRSWDPQVRFATRVGGRLGHARAAYSETQLKFNDGTPPLAGTTETITANYFRHTDTYGGLFVGTEAILLQRQFSFGQFQWTVDGEFSNDWINFNDIVGGNLGAASVMMGFMLSR